MKMKLWMASILCLSIILGVFLRVQNVPLLDGRYFLGTDAYRQVRQAEQILKQGKLPDVDVLRSAPVGRNNTEQFTLYPHVLAYAVRGLRIPFPDLTLTKAAIFYPVVGFALILPLFFLLTRRLTDTSTALLASVGLSVAPTFLPRTVAGFADRDAFTMLLLLSTLYLWTLSWSATDRRRQMGFALLTGLTTGLLGRTWAGVGYLTTLLALWNLAYLLTDQFSTRRYVPLCLWSVPALALMLSSAAFHRHLSDSFTWLALGPPMGVLVLGTVYWGVLKVLVHQGRSSHEHLHTTQDENQSWSARICACLRSSASHSQQRTTGMEGNRFSSSPLDRVASSTCQPANVSTCNGFPFGWSLLAALALTTGLLASVVAGPGWLWDKMHVLVEHFSSPLGHSRLMQSISEMQSPYFLHWWTGYGFFFFLAIGGAGWLFYQTFQGLGRQVWYALCGFVLLVGGVVYSRLFPHLVVNGQTLASHFLHLGTSGAFVLLLSGLLIHRHIRVRPGIGPVAFDGAHLLLVVWFIWGLILTRAASRFDFFFTPVALILGCRLLTQGVRWSIPREAYHTSIGALVTVVLCCQCVVVFWRGNPAHLLWCCLLGTASLVVLSVWAERRYADTKRRIDSQITGRPHEKQDVPRRHREHREEARTPCLSSARSVPQWPNRIAPAAQVVGAPFLRTLFLPLTGFLILALFVGLPGNPGFASIAQVSVGRMAPSVTPDWQTTFDWMSKNTPEDAVIAAWWDYGGWINALAERATVVDEEQNLYWVHLLARHVLMAQDEGEALEFLKTHGATHLLLSHREVDNIGWVSWIGSDVADDRRCSLGVLPRRTPARGEDRQALRFHHPEGMYLDTPVAFRGQVYPGRTVRLTDITVPLNGDGDFGMPEASVMADNYRFSVTLSEVHFYGQHREFPDADVSGCVVLNAPPERGGERKRESIRSATFLPSVARESLLVRLFLLGESSDVFTPVYPTTSDSMAPVRVWEVHYPSQTPTNPDYLQLEAPDPAVLRP